MSFTVWQVANAQGQVQAQPIANSTVRFSLTETFTRAEWKEFKAQTEELFDIAEREDSV